MNTVSNITETEKSFFQENGYLIKRKFVDTHMINSLQSKVIEHLQSRVLPFELEQEVQYPGSPLTKNEIGGDTIRRLRLAYNRDPIFKQWAENKKVRMVLKSLFESDTLYLVQSHHNCIMTKQPQYSSETHWHKDTRYWNFENNQLINTWLPLGEETRENGCLQVIPKTHEWKTPEKSLDKLLFLRKDLEENNTWINQKVYVELQKGDLLFFHAALFHAAGRNLTDQSKNAVVFTYHSDNNVPIQNSNSVTHSDVLLD